MNILVLPRTDRMDGIRTTRDFILNCYFDAELCADGLDAAEAYRKEWDQKRAIYRDVPYHGPESNGADALRYGAVYETALLKSPREARRRMMAPDGIVKKIGQGQGGARQIHPRSLNPSGYT